MNLIIFLLLCFTVYSFIRWLSSIKEYKRLTRKLDILQKELDIKIKELKERNLW